MKNLIGLYEKALPGNMEWVERLQTIKELGFDFMELSIDESDMRLSRLYWSKKERQSLLKAIWDTGVPILSMCLSCLRRYALGSRCSAIRQKAIELITRGIDLACDIGVRVIQIPGYDVYYEQSGNDTCNFFLDSLQKAVFIAERKQVMLGVETIDTPFINSVEKYLYFDRLISSPWLGVYPDIGNLDAWGNDVSRELTAARHRIVGVHVKDTRRRSSSFQGQFRGVSFGDGNVDFVKVFTTLKELKYSGPLVIEIWGDKVADPIGEIIYSRQFVLDILDKVYDETQNLDTKGHVKS